MKMKKIDFGLKRRNEDRLGSSLQPSVMKLDCKETMVHTV
jgi:hypothetical protein